MESAQNTTFQTPHRRQAVLRHADSITRLADPAEARILEKACTQRHAVFTDSLLEGAVVTTRSVCEDLEAAKMVLGQKYITLVPKSEEHAR